MAKVTENDVLEEIRDQLEAIKVPGAREATPENTWSELDVDSLDIVELVKALEDRFGITISDADLKPIESIGDTVVLVMRLLGEGPEGQVAA
jgi:acyl carrier protein